MAALEARAPVLGGFKRHGDNGVDQPGRHGGAELEVGDEA